MGRLAFNVAVRDPETGYPVVFLADSEPPAWVASLVFDLIGFAAEDPEPYVVAARVLILIGLMRSCNTGGGMAW